MSAFVMWFAVASCIAFAALLLIVDKKLIEGRRIIADLNDQLRETERELARWRVLGAGIALDYIEVAKDAVEQAEWLR